MHTHDVDWSAHLDRLRAADDLEAAVSDTIATDLLTGGERLVVDLGCGAGGMAVALAARLPEGSRIVLVDGTPALLDAALARVRAVPRVAAGAVTVVARQADLAGGVPLEDCSADLIWASGVVHHLPDQQATLVRLAGALAAGGRLALGEGGLRPRHLPWDLGRGAPGLEARLDAALEGWVAAMRADLPGQRRLPHGWPEALRGAGLVDVASRSYLLDLPAPLPDVAVELARSGWAGLAERERHQPRLSPEDRETLEHLADPDSELFRALRDQLFQLAVRTVHAGRRPETRTP